MDSMNSFADLQALQQPSLGQALTMQPQQQPQQPQQPAQGPPATPEEYGQRVQGWTDTLSEMLANPMVSVALLQMGAALSAGRSAPEAMADTAGAVGRAGALTDQYRRRQEGDEMLRRKAGLEEKKFGLDEREFGLRERLTEAQIKNYERMARGGGGGGAGADGAAMSVDEAKAMYDQCMAIPGATPELCTAAVTKKRYGLTPGQWVGGSAAPYQQKLDQDRLADLEKRQDELGVFGKTLPKDDLVELNRLKQQRARDQWQPTQAQPQMPPPGGAQVLQPPNATATGPFDAPVASFKSEAEALAAAQAGKVPFGPGGVAVVIVNGQRYRLRNKQ